LFSNSFFIIRSFYDKNNNQLPDKIIVYRDGLGSGDIARVKETEIAAIKVILKKKNSNFNGN